MKKIIAVIFVLLAAWCAYWFVGRQTLIGALNDAKSEMAADGLNMRISNIRVSGFPLKYQAQLSDLDITGRDGGRYQAELVNINASALKPTIWTLSADTPARVQFKGSEGQLYDFILAGEEMRVEMGSSVTGKLKSVHVTMRGLKAVASAGGLAPPVLGIEAGEVSISPSVAPLQDGMSARFDVSGVTLADKSVGDLQRAFGSNIGRVTGTGLATGLATLEPEDIEAWQTSGAVTVPDFALEWGQVGFFGEVDLDMSQLGANGEATLGVSDADALVESFVDARMLSQSQAMGATFLLMAAPTDPQGRVVLTFPIENSAVTLFGQVLHQF